MCCPFPCYISILLTLLLQWVHCHEQIQSTIRLTKVANCNMTGLKWLLEDFSVHYQYPKTYITSHYRVVEDIKVLNKVYFHLERCNDQGYDCEDFQNWRIDRFCRMLVWKNQVWSEYIRNIRPSIRCPVKKAIYIQNTTVDVDAVINWFPDTIKYRWKIYSKVTNENDIVIYCSVMEAHIHQFRIQDSRKPPRKPRNLLALNRPMNIF